MKNITLKKEDIGKGELVLINPDYTLKSTINNLVSFDEEYNNIKLNNIANYSLHLILNNINAENKIVPVSGYRTLEEQKDIYNTSFFLKDFIYPNKPLIYEEYKIFFIPYKDESISLDVEENYNISGNNVDGFILTIKGEK